MLDQMLFETVSAYPHKTALIYDKLRMSYTELYASICGFSRGLASLGVKPGECIAVVLPNCVEFVVSFFAAAQLDTVFLPINPLLKEHEIKYYLNDCGVRTIITDAQHLPLCHTILSNLDTDIHLIVTDTRDSSNHYFYDLILQRTERHHRPDVQLGEVLYQFSSGSTGKPKRVSRTQKNLFHEAKNFTDTIGLTADDNILCIVPLFHAHGLGNCMLAAARSGATLTILEQFVHDGTAIEVPFAARCARVVQLIEQEQVTILPGVPYTFSALAETPDAPQANLSSLKLCFSAGNFLPKDTFDNFLQRFGIPVRQLYGCTEAGSVSINLDADSTTTYHSVGRPLQNIDVQIVDDAGNSLPCDCVGEIIFKSEALTSGYFNQPDLNQAAFKHGYFFTGDLGKKDAQGRLYITGRKKIFIDTGGHKVDPLEVEEVLLEHPHVQEAVVVGVGAPYGGEIVKAVIVPNGDCRQDAIIAYCRSRLADFKVPRMVQFVADIPKSPLGKILRKNLILDDEISQQIDPIRQTVLTASSQEQRYAVLEAYLQQQLGQMLGVDRSHIDPLTSLGDFGLDSVMAVDLKVRLESTLGIALSATLVWNYPNVAALARYLADSIVPHQLSGAPAEQAIIPPADTATPPPMSEPIAIIGMGCRFPGGANDPEAFWRVLHDGIDTITEIPAERWDVNAFYNPNQDAPGKMATRWGGFVDLVDHFDPAFFGISPREAIRMDPQQRLLLEVVWEALERAGQSLDSLAGSATGVFVGVSNSDYFQLQIDGSPIADPYLETGNRNSFAAGRLCYLLNLRGPSVALDTVCSSSLVAVHLACQSLRTGESRLAIAGGVNLILSPLVSIMASKWGMMAADGRCKTFDRRANGFVRSEGCGIVVLKRLSDALADHDPILAVIRGSAINHDGRSSGLTAPNGQAQQALVQQALQNAGVDPASISYVETHGSGTALGDPIEVEALASVLGLSQSDARPCPLGAVKTNIGHLESVAGVAGLIKTVLALQHEAIPGNLHYQTLNPHITLEGTRFTIPTSLQPWPASDTPRYAGVSSFGLSGTNAHVVLEEAPRRATNRQPATSTDQAYLVPLSARSTGALRDLAHAYRTFLNTPSAPALHDLAYTASLRRTHHTHRLALVGATFQELTEQLDAFLQDEVRPGLTFGEAGAGPQQRLVFVFPGQGAQWFGMGRQLLAQEPVFRDALQACAAAFKPYVDWSVIEQLTAPSDANRLDEIDVLQPTLFAIQVALVALWRSWGVIPSAVIGHSMGEVAAAHVAGILSLPDAARIICRRSQLLRRIRGQGAMLIAEISLGQAETLLMPYADQVSIAVSNSTRSTVLAGDPTVLESLRTQLEAQSIFCRWVKVDVAAHSPQVDPLRTDLQTALEGLAPQAAALPLYSTVTSQVCTGTELGSAYWVRNLREPVLFGPTVQHLIDDGHDRFVEISPHPLLLSAIAEGLQEREQTGQVLASLQRETDERLALLGSLGALYTTGYPVDWSSLYPAGGACVTLPSYPWQRQRFWIEPPSPGVAALPSWRALAGPGAHPLLGMPIELATAPEVHAWSGILTLSHLPYLSDHQVQDTVVLPASAYVEMVLAAAQSVFGSGAHELTHLVLHQMLVLIEDQPLATQVVLTAEGADRANVQVFSRRQDAPSEAAWNLHASVSVRRAAAAAAPAPAPNSMLDIQARCSERIAGEAHYRAMTARGLHYGPCFRGINQIWRRVGEALAQVSMPDTIDPEPSYQIHPALLDACLQTFTTAQFGTGDQDGESTPSIPVGFRSIQMFQRPAHEPVWVHIRLQSDPATSEAEPCGDMDVFDASGQLLLTLRGLQMRRLEPVEHATRADRLSSSLYALQWQAQPLLPPASQPTTAPATWLILGDRQGVGQRLQALLAAQGHHAVLVIPNTATSVPAGAHTLDPSDSAAYTKLLQTVLAANHPPCKGVVHLWSLDTPDDIDPTMVDPALGWGSIVPLVQALIHTGTRARLWFVTRGAQPVGESAARIALGQVPQWGLGLTIAQEHPELRCSRIDLHAEPMANEATMLLSEFAAREFEDQVALRPDARHVARLVAWVPTAEPQRKVRAGDQPFRLEIATPGRLDKLALRATTRQAPGPGEVEIQVEAAGLNFKDVLLALGAISDGAAEGSPRLGQECAGRIMAVGPGVTAFEVGQEVVALASMSFSTFVIADQRLVAPKPAHLTFAEAATIPVAFLTAYYALHHVARLMPGERILIHAATGGVGLAAIQLAQRCGAEIFATAGSPEKRAFLKALGVAHVMDSRSLAFVDQVRELTAGAGVDVVLNSLGGEFIAASFGVLADYGRFVELGRRDYDQDRKLGLKPFLKNLSFSLLDLRGMMDQRPQVISAALQEVMALVTTRALTPTVRQVVPVERIDEAFHTMAQARHIGKIAVSFAERSRTQIQVGMPTQVVRPDGTYVITGGLGGIGLTVARWLVAQGAQHLVLIGRRAPDRAAAQVVADLQEHGTTVVARQADVTDRAALAAVFTSMADMPPIRGVIHAAAVLNDATVLKLDAPGFAQVLAPKVHGAWNLHQLTRDLPLDFFVLFSSVASLIGSSGQGNYAAANAFLDMLAHYRQAQGLPALSINWGAWAEVGLAAERSNRGERLMQQGIASFTPEEGVELLGRLLRYAPVQVGAVLLNLRQWLQAYPGAAALPLFIQLRQTDTAEDVPQSGQHAMRTALEAAEPTQRRALLETHLREQIAQVLRLSPSQIGVRTPLGTIGFDSLLALELRNRLEASLGLALSGTLIWGYPTIQALVPYLAEKMDIPLEPAKSAAPPPKEPEPAPQADHVLDFLLDQGVLDELEQLSDEEVRRMLST